MKATIIILLLVFATTAGAQTPRLLALCYHDVVADPLEAAKDPMAVTIDNLVKQFAWLAGQGFEPITLNQWVAARAGGTLPEKPVLLTFDDGYTSFADHVLPLLNLFDFPAVLAPVTGWIDADAGGVINDGSRQVSRDRFLTWEQLRQIAASGRVEIATHSHDLHRGRIGNPFGNAQPAATTRIWDEATGTYETEAAYLARVREDLKRSSMLIRQNIGHAPRTVVWPYGAHNAHTSEIALSLGLSLSLTLDETPNSPDLDHVHRLLIDSGTSLQEFAMTARNLYQKRPVRAAHVDMDYLYDADPAQSERNLDRLLDRIKAMQISVVFLQAYADPDGDGVANALYFPNRHLPVRSDLFNRVSWQLKSRAGVKVFAWMPVLAFELPDSILNKALAVKSFDGSHADRYHRLSPFHPQARQIIEEIYADLGSNSRFAGVLFHDDAFLTDQEDVNPTALKYYRDNWHIDLRPDTPISLLAERKTKFLIEFTLTLAEQLRVYQPALLTARNLYARVLTEPESQFWFAQSFTEFQQNYDYTAVMAMPLLEEADHPGTWIAELVTKVRAFPGAMERTIFELQTVDWRNQRPLATNVLAEHMDLLLDNGVRHIAYYPDDFIKGRPSLELIRSRLSVNDYPVLRE